MSPLLITGITELAKGLGKSLTDSNSKSVSTITLVLFVHQVVSGFVASLESFTHIDPKMIEWTIYSVVVLFIFLIPKEWFDRIIRRIKALKELGK